MAQHRGETGRQAAWRKRNPWARHVEYARRRCTDPDNKDWKHYGAKGIKVTLTAKEAGVLWARDNAAALREPSLDRIDPAKDYTFDNCRFIEKKLNERLPHDAELQAEIDEELPAWVTERETGYEYEAPYA